MLSPLTRARNRKGAKVTPRAQRICEQWTPSRVFSASVIKDFELGVDLCYPENGKLRLPHTRPQTSPRSQSSRTKSMARASTARYKVRLQTRTASPASLHSDSRAG